MCTNVAEKSNSPKTRPLFVLNKLPPFLTKLRGGKFQPYRCGTWHKNWLPISARPNQTHSLSPACAAFRHEWLCRSVIHFGNLWHLSCRLWSISLFVRFSDHFLLDYQFLLPFHSAMSTMRWSNNSYMDGGQYVCSGLGKLTMELERVGFWGLVKAPVCALIWVQHFSCSSGDVPWTGQATFSQEFIEEWSLSDGEASAGMPAKLPHKQRLYGKA